MLLVGSHQFGKGEVDILDCILGHAFELTREDELAVLVADSHGQNHHIIIKHLSFQTTFINP